MALTGNFFSFSFYDTDCDLIEFRLTAAGKLQEFVNHKLELGDVRNLKYKATSSMIEDDTGDFNFRYDEQIAKCTILRTFATLSGVPWHGDEPASLKKLSITDSEGDIIEFRLSEDEVLQEFVNGKLEISEVRQISYSSTDGTIIDDSGEFRLVARNRLEESILLRVMAFQANISWIGDDPLQMLLKWIKPMGKTLSSTKMDIPPHMSKMDMEVPMLVCHTKATAPDLSAIDDEQMIYEFADFDDQADMIDWECVSEATERSWVDVLDANDLMKVFPNCETPAVPVLNHVEMAKECTNKSSDDASRDDECSSLDSDWQALEL